MDSDTSVGLKRRVTEMELNREPLQYHQEQKQEQEQEHESSEIVPSLKQEADTVDNTSSPVSDSSFNGLHNKKVKCSLCRESESYMSIRENQELGFISGAKEIQERFGSEKEETKLCDLVSGSSGVEVIGEDFGRKVQNFGEEVQEMQYTEMGFVSDVEEKQETFDTVNQGVGGVVYGSLAVEKTINKGEERVVSVLVHKEEENSVASEVGFSGNQEFDKLNEEVSTSEEKKSVVEIEMGSVVEEGLITFTSEVADKNQKLLGKKMELDSFLDAKKKQLLEELGLIPILEKVSDSESTGGILDVSTLIRSVETEARNANAGGKGSGGEEVHKMVQNGAKKKDGFKGIDGSVGCSLKVEVIDDTALIETVPLLKIGNDRGKEMGFVDSAKDLERNVKKNGNMEVDGKKVKRPRRRGKGMKKVLETNGNDNTSTQMAEAQYGCLKNEDGTKKMYSRSEMEALRFVNIVEQRQKWKEIYNGLRPVVVREYDDLVSWKHEKHAHLNFDPRQRFGKKADTPAILREVCSGNVDNELENVETNETEDVDPSDPAWSHSVSGEGGYAVLEGECSEDDDSDEDYASIQRPAFLIDGEPNFDSGPPEDGLEYLRRVRWEAARIPKVKVAKVDRNKFNKEQSAYMPKIPDIAKCPEHLLPLKQWEDSFIADFSELRLALSHIGGSSAEVSGKLQSMFIVHEANYSHQLPERTILEKFDNLTTNEVPSCQPIDCSHLESMLDQPSFLTTEDDDTLMPVENSSPKISVNESSGNYPTLSAILGIDSVARVSMLRKRISSVESLSTLSRNDCVWLFALCAAVDTPLGADTCAALRSLLRKCASLRAAKSELDDEVIMLNILATISGRYFGQSGS